MTVEIHQGPDNVNSDASLRDSKTGARLLHLAANSRVPTTLSFKIDQTSPGTLQGLGGETAVTIPGGAMLVALRIWGKLNSNTTSGTLTIGLDNITSNHFLSAYNVADAPTGLGQAIPRAVTNLWSALPTMPVGQAHTIVGHYAETATSTFGGPWYVDIDYILPTPA